MNFCTNLLVCFVTFLPLVKSSFIGLGVEIQLGNTQQYREEFEYITPQVVRVTFSWAKQETSPGVYTWLPALKADTSFLASKGVKYIIASVHDTPPFYNPGRVCEPPNRGNLPDLQKFIIAASEYYPEINVWEFWNEQDFPNGLDYYYGCWGLSNAQFYGEALNWFYDGVKEVDSKDLVMFGSLGTHNFDFLKAALTTVKRFDVLGLHWYGENVRPMWIDLDNAVRFRKELAKIIVEPVWITETAWLCNSWPDCPGQFKLDQGEWLNRVVAEWLMPEYYPVVLWYDLSSNDWLDAGMHDYYQGDETRKPVWYQMNNIWWAWSYGFIPRAENEYINRVDRFLGR